MSDELEHMHCEICGEPFTMLDVENGGVAEMFDPTTDPPDGSYICHVTCGVNKRLEVA